MLKLLRSLVMPLAKLSLSVAAIIFGFAVATDLIGSVSLPLDRLANHALVGIGAGVFAACLLAVIAVVFHILISTRRDRT
jgi:hypothetical protein